MLKEKLYPWFWVKVFHALAFIETFLGGGILQSEFGKGRVYISGVTVKLQGKFKVLSMHKVAQLDINI